jgi:hypothetical protein
LALQRADIAFHLLHGEEAIDTARCNTCWKELEKVLWPLNVTGVDRELDVLLVVPITNYLCKIGAEGFANPVRLTEENTCRFVSFNSGSAVTESAVQT